MSDVELFESLCEKYDIRLQDVLDRLGLPRARGPAEQKDFRGGLSSAQDLDEGERALQADFADWLNNILDLRPPLEPPNMWDRLSDGVILCQLLPKIDASLKCKYDPKPVGHFKKLDNATNFLEACERGLGISKNRLFDPQDLVEARNLRGVMSCFLGVAKSAHVRFKVTPPQVIRLEAETDAAMKAPIDDAEIDRLLHQSKRVHHEVAPVQEPEPEPPAPPPPPPPEPERRTVPEPAPIPVRPAAPARPAAAPAAPPPPQKPYQAVPQGGHYVDLDLRDQQRRLEEQRRREEQQRQDHMRYLEEQRRRQEREEQLWRAHEQKKIEEQKLRYQQQQQRQHYSPPAPAYQPPVRSSGEDAPVFQYKPDQGGYKGWRYIVTRNDPIDDAVGRAVNALPSMAPAVKLWRLQSGQYLIEYPQRIVFFVRVLRDVALVRVGGGWEDLFQWLVRRLSLHPETLEQARARPLSRPVAVYVGGQRQPWSM
eukprot:Hpha_TRINITY_DN3615_c0_g1::TRINITY_DN3615_c0_g1_i1::g.989::m.989